VTRVFLTWNGSQPQRDVEYRQRSEAENQIDYGFSIYLFTTGDNSSRASRAWVPYFYTNAIVK
jgi:hypothetical protein